MVNLLDATILRTVLVLMMSVDQYMYLPVVEFHFWKMIVNVLLLLIGLQVGFGAMISSPVQEFSATCWKSL